MRLSELNAEVLLCRKCSRLVAWREQVGREKRRAYQGEEYWSKPVPGFGDPHGRVFVVGLAPGAHGSNRTGRQFTGDASGDFLFPALFRAGFASQPKSTSRDDGLTLNDLYTAPVCRCVPPGNKPTPTEMKNCQSYLEREIQLVHPKVFVALGRIAFDAILRILTKDSGNWIKGNNARIFLFSHNAVFQVDAKYWVVASYHPSRQNTQTGRLTEKMFDEVWTTAQRLLKDN
jgi:uracil-DNA glycosylase family 4